jgi:hypothetical protein
VRRRVLVDPEKRFLAVPFYANLSFFFAIRSKQFARVAKQLGFAQFAGSWRELAAQCKRWDEEQTDSGDLFFRALYGTTALKATTAYFLRYCIAFSRRLRGNRLT